jgi:D-alanyl-D-alanine carboxypeptidase
MPHPVASTSLVTPPSRLRRLTFLALGICVAALLAALVTIVVNATFASAVAPFTPSADDGQISEGTIVTLADDVPAIARLDPALRDAMRRAETDAAAEGLSFEVTSGWRSAEYQQWLLDDAIEHYGSEDLARQFVATPDRSSHVTGDAVDIVPIDAQFWLIEHGSQYGICQTYANERWHFELATEPGGVCPEMKADAAA